MITVSDAMMEVVSAWFAAPNSTECDNSLVNHTMKYYREMPAYCNFYYYVSEKTAQYSYICVGNPYKFIVSTGIVFDHTEPTNA